MSTTGFGVTHPNCQRAFESSTLVLSGVLIVIFHYSQWSVFKTFSFRFGLCHLNSCFVNRLQTFNFSKIIKMTHWCFSWVCVELFSLGFSILILTILENLSAVTLKLLKSCTRMCRPFKIRHIQHTMSYLFFIC